MLEFEDITKFYEKFKDSLDVCKRGISVAAWEQFRSYFDDDKVLHPLEYLVKIGNECVKESCKELGNTFTVTYDVAEFCNKADMIMLYISALIYKIDCGVPYQVILRFESRKNRVRVKKEILVTAKLMKIDNLISMRFDLI